MARNGESSLMEEACYGKRHTEWRTGGCLQIILQPHPLHRDIDSIDEAQSQPLNLQWLGEFRVNIPKAQRLALKFMPTVVRLKAAENKAVSIELGDMEFIGGLETQAL